MSCVFVIVACEIMARVVDTYVDISHKVHVTFLPSIAKNQVADPVSGICLIQETYCDKKKKRNCGKIECEMMLQGQAKRN